MIRSYTAWASGIGIIVYHSHDESQGVIWILAVITIVFASLLESWCEYIVRIDILIM